MTVKLNDDDIQAALGYYYETASKEVEEFHKPEVISRVAIKRDGILYHKSRILEGQRFSQAGELEGMEILWSTAEKTSVKFIRQIEFGKLFEFLADVST